MVVADGAGAEQKARRDKLTADQLGALQKLCVQSPPEDGFRRNTIFVRHGLAVLSRDVGDTRAGFLKWVRASGFGVDCDICTDPRRPSWSTIMPR